MRIARLLTTTAWAAALILVTACGSSSRLGRHSGQMQERTSTPRLTKAEKKQQQESLQQEQLPQTGQQPLTDQSAEATDTPKTKAPEVNKEEFLRQVTDNCQTNRFITSKVRFSVEAGNRQMTLTGNLKMKRDDVIRLQLMAFGFVEAGRLEFTKEYVLIVDRINKQYLKVPYEQLEFLRNSGIDFNMLQALFWNELFQPGKGDSDKKEWGKYNTESGIDGDVVVSIESGKLSYRWLTQQSDGHIKMANILYADRYRGNYQLNWDYEDFKVNDRKFFPMKHKVSFSTPDKEVKFDMTLNYLGNDDDWETRTILSGKYRQMPVDDILRRFMSL